jgi:3-oxoacyl-(acyl-carrier-protein) synthase
MSATRVGVFGWGVVAPQAPNIEAFEKKLAEGGSWLEPFDVPLGFGKNNFLVGTPAFSLADYKPWIDERFGPTRFGQVEKLCGSAQYAIGAFIQSLAQNPGIEKVLKELGQEARVYLGTGVGDLTLYHELSVRLYRAQRAWLRFWASPERNSALRAHLESNDPKRAADAPSAPNPDAPQREEAEDRFWGYWAERSPELAQYLEELRMIESQGVLPSGTPEQAKLQAMKEKRVRLHNLQQKWRAPDPPWNAVAGHGVFNNVAAVAAQVSMIGGITGMTMAPCATCATFGHALYLAISAIRNGEARAVVVGASDPPPNPLLLASFYNARVVSADATVSRPLTDLRGTHLAGGSAVWIVGDLDFMRARGFAPLGLEPLSVGVSADAGHPITPSREGPLAAIASALRGAGASAAEIVTWDMHATATPGDVTEIDTFTATLGADVFVTARKGTFGHGMGAGGGWELTAQYLGLARGKLHPTPLTKEDLNTEIAKLHERFVFDSPVECRAGLAGKISMGIGGLNACILSRPWQP